MKKTFSRLMRHRSAFIIGGVRYVLYILLALCFFGTMSIYNWPLRHASRTLATTILTYLVMAMVMRSVYGGFDVGRKKNKPVISSMALGAFLTDAVTYLQLQIMNVNENNNATLQLFGQDFPMLLLCFALQMVCIIVLVHVGNDLYFSLNPPKRCLLVLSDMSEKDAVLRKINRYKMQWQVADIALADDPAIINRMRDVETVFLAGLPPTTQITLLKDCYALQRDVLCMAQLEDIMISNARQVIIDDCPFLSMEYHRMTIGQRIIKRLMDIVISLLVLLITSPVLAVIALAILAEDGRPIIFRQKRMSVNGRVFRICKFRTMTKESSAQKDQVSCEAGDKRITRTGQVLRRLRLDELPQFWNILKGDMTIVGPRPEMLENVEKYKAQLPSFVYREKMKAGLTGFAQIEGRYNTTPQDKLMLDLMYIESFSIWTDIKLIFRTLTVFFKSDSTEGFSSKQE